MQVAQDLIGKYLVRHFRGKNRAAMILETEAYHGIHDRASHASGGRTPRTEVMFGPPGHLYIYLVYGMHHCLNVSTMSDGFPAAVLIRAIDLPSGDGPGKLCRLLSITRAQNTLGPSNRELWFEDRGVVIPRSRILRGPRIGVAYAGPFWARRRWRFTYAKAA